MRCQAPAPRAVVRRLLSAPPPLARIIASEKEGVAGQALDRTSYPCCPRAGPKLDGLFASRVGARLPRAAAPFASPPLKTAPPNIESRRQHLAEPAHLFPLFPSLFTDSYTKGPLNLSIQDPTSPSLSARPSGTTTPNLTAPTPSLTPSHPPYAPHAVPPPAYATHAS